MSLKAYCQSPFGCIRVTGSAHGIQSIQVMMEKKKCPKHEVPDELKDCIEQLQEYFAKERTQFDLTLDFGNAPEFHRAVWEQLIDIPYGHTTSYSAIAEKLGDPKKMRAVGQANRNNPIPIIVPCHRVIAKNGDLQGYYYGLDMKRKLLELENPMSFASQGSLF